MTKTAAETVAFFQSFNTHYFGPTTSSVRNEYNGKWYANPHTVAVGRATVNDGGEYYCADSVTNALMWAGIDIRKACPGFCNCGALYNYMLAAPASGLYGFKTVSLDDATTGDITLLHFDGMWGHVLMHRAPNSGGNMLTTEGDTSNAKWPGSSTVGGVQTDRTRRLADWRGYTHTFRPTGYGTVPDTGLSVVHSWTGQDLNATFTIDDIKVLQGVIGVTRDGVAGPDTVDALEKVAGYDPDHMLDVTGSNTVRKYQASINAAIKAGLTLDGIVGPKMADALHTYFAKGHRFEDLTGVNPKPPAPPAPPKPVQLEVDGYLGVQTLNRWGAVMGVHTGKADLVRAVQIFLNANGGLDERGRKLDVDGVGIYDNRDHDTASSHTQAGLQRYLKTPNDGVLSGPPTGSTVVKVLQQRLNAATTGSKRF